MRGGNIVAAEGPRAAEGTARSILRPVLVSTQWMPGGTVFRGPVSPEIYPRSYWMGYVRSRDV